jgi:predicted type IV restriction endonuclease
MKEKLISFISELRTDRKVISFDEAATKQALVLRLLSILGWDLFNVEEVRPEYTVAGKRVDYALRLSNSSKVFIEVKRLGEPLEDHQEQLLSYSFQEGVPLAILTNGLTWWFYRPPNEGSWEQRRFYTIDLSQQEPQDIGSRLIDFLSKDNVSSGKAIEHAEAMYKSQRKRVVVDAAVPKAWNQIVSDPDDLLIELISETTEKLSGFRPEIEAIEDFLTKHSNQLVITEATPTAAVRTNVPRQAQPARDTEGYLGKSITGFTFRGKHYQVKTWKDMLISLADVLYQTHKTDFRRVLSMHGTKRTYFSQSPDKMREPRKVGNSGFYVETHWSAKSMVKLTLDLLALFGYSEQELKIEIR